MNDRPTRRAIWAEETPPELIAAMKEDMAGWQPIETAPFEERILLWCEDNRNRKNASAIVFGRVVDFSNGERVAYGDGMNGDWTFTHWMPLPAAPVDTRPKDGDKGLGSTRE